ncbi:hypothetical protein INR49_015691 [Caranx melampygus]|nr:hypothetical protein INR49_015691 [Caranx melampygus]
MAEQQGKSSPQRGPVCKQATITDEEAKEKPHEESAHCQHFRGLQRILLLFIKAFVRLCEPSGTMRAVQSPTTFLLISLLYVKQLQQGHALDISSDAEKHRDKHEVITQTTASEQGPEQDNSLGYKGTESPLHSRKASDWVGKPKQR